MQHRRRQFFAHIRCTFATSVVLAALLATTGGAAANTLADTELEGGTYRSFELVAPVPDFCRKVCEKDEGCQAWTFSWPGKKGKRAMCFLKREVRAQRKDTCCISGYRERGIGSSLKRLARRWLQKQDETENESPATTSDVTSETARRTAVEEIKRRTAEQTPAASGTAPSPAARDSQPPAEQPVDEVALAEKRAFCRSYARRARQANREAEELGCGLRGGLWGASYNGYFNWCMKNDPQRAERNTQLRERALQRCRVAAQRPEPPQTDDYTPYPRRAWPPRFEQAEPPAALELRRQARWMYSWLKRAGPGPRATPWRPTLSGKCPLVRACDCPQGDSCRLYSPGEIAVAWPLGCDGPPTYMVCRVRRR